MAHLLSGSRRFAGSRRSFGEGQRSIRLQSDIDAVASRYLASCDEVGQRVDDAALDDTLQMPRAILGIGALLQQPFLHFRHAVEGEMTLADRVHDALLHLGQLQVQDLLQLFRTQGSENDYLIKTVQEFRGKLLARGFAGGAFDLGVQVLVPDRIMREKAHSSLHQVAHLRRAEVGGQKNQAMRKIDVAVVTKSQRAFVEDRSEEHTSEL